MPQVLRVGKMRSLNLKGFWFSFFKRTSFSNFSNPKEENKLSISSIPKDLLKRSSLSTDSQKTSLFLNFLFSKFKQNEENIFLSLKQDLLDGNSDPQTFKEFENIIKKTRFSEMTKSQFELLCQNFQNKKLRLLVNPDLCSELKIYITDEISKGKDRRILKSWRDHPEIPGTQSYVLVFYRIKNHTSFNIKLFKSVPNNQLLHLLPIIEIHSLFSDEVKFAGFFGLSLGSIFSLFFLQSLFLHSPGLVASCLLASCTSCYYWNLKSENKLEYLKFKSLLFEEKIRLNSLDLLSSLSKNSLSSKYSHLLLLYTFLLWQKTFLLKHDPPTSSTKTGFEFEENFKEWLKREFGKDLGDSLDLQQTLNRLKSLDLITSVSGEKDEEVEVTDLDQSLQDLSSRTWDFNQVLAKSSSFG